MCFVGLGGVQVSVCLPTKRVQRSQQQSEQILSMELLGLQRTSQKRDECYERRLGGWRMGLDRLPRTFHEGTAVLVVLSSDVWLIILSTIMGFRPLVYPTSSKLEGGRYDLKPSRSLLRR